jgi:hypothetical protein
MLLQNMGGTLTLEIPVYVRFTTFKPLQKIRSSRNKPLHEKDRLDSK